MDTEKGPLTAKALLGRIPRDSIGGLKGGDEAHEISRLLSMYSYSQKELGLFEQRILNLAKRYGHEGLFVLKKYRRDVLSMA